MSVDIRVGDCLDVLRTLDAESVQCVVTSPPYWGLRDYGVAGQLGLEKTPDEYVARIVDVFREVRRVLKADGVLWLNLGDSYAHSLRQSPNKSGDKQNTNAGSIRRGFAAITPGFKEKDLIGVPWMVAFALRQDGWYLRSDIVWAKPNGMPESVRDRPTRSHEMVFLLSKSERYFYDIEAARTPAAPATETRLAQNIDAQEGSARANGGAKTNGKMKAVVKYGATVETSPNRRLRSTDEMIESSRENILAGVNLRTVWWISPAQFREGHFATMPTALAEICIVAGSRVGDTILDPFGGAGTTGLVADRLSRHALLIELNPEYAAMARRRITDDCPLFSDGAA